MASVQQLLARAADLPGDSARRDGEILLGHCLSQSRTWLYTWPEREVAPAQAEQYLQCLVARRQGRPVAHLIGRREFWSLALAVNEHTLIPRPETETLVEWALDLCLPETATVLDLGTGSGAIALALASERQAWQLTALDASRAALEMAEANAASLGLNRVGFIHSNWYEKLAGERFNLIVSNPPYIEKNDPHLAEGDVRFEPRMALVAEDTGLADLGLLIAGAPAHLNQGGWLLLEHGFEQGQAVRNLLGAGGFEAVATRRDIGGRERISGGRWRAQ